jgi:hypothetical protein
MNGASQPPVSVPTATPALTIDRLIFDVPGLAPADAAAIAQAVGERLARAGIKDAPPKIGITLGPIGGSHAELAARIAAALLERLM